MPPEGYEDRLTQMDRRDVLKNRLAATWAPDLPEDLTDRAFYHAWEQGHAAGEHEVEDCYEDLANLMKGAYAAGLAAQAK